jgi:hypothetical protein
VIELFAPSCGFKKMFVASKLCFCSGEKRMHQGGDDAIQEDLPKVTKHNKKKPKK